jgi:hypothetical protein
MTPDGRYRQRHRGQRHRRRHALIHFTLDPINLRPALAIKAGFFVIITDNCDNLTQE